MLQDITIHKGGHTMKKLISILLCTLALIGCSKAENTESSTPSTDATTSATTAPIVECDWEVEDEVYESIDDFLASAKETMYYYDVDTDTNIPIEPYVINYDEQKYDLIKVYRVNNNKYDYSFIEKETGRTIKFSFFYYCGYDEEAINSEVINLRDALVSIYEDETTIYNDYSAVIYPESCCKMYFTYYFNDSANTELYASKEPYDVVSEIASDFSLTKN